MDKTWKTSYGETILISKMTDHHLLNAYRMQQEISDALRLFHGYGSDQASPDLLEEINKRKLTPLPVRGDKVIFYMNSLEEEDYMWEDVFGPGFQG